MIPADVRFEDIAEGLESEHEYRVDASLTERFIEAFGDSSPIHVDDRYAKSRGFAGRVAHGAILNGFVSHFVGMVFPGRRALLLSVDMRYLRPTYLGTVVRLRSKVAQRVESQRALVLACTFEDAESRAILARARVQVTIADA
jgi:3-hydroxybutyryl-CoA dehydratase